jgi:hypothetical protein
MKKYSSMYHVFFKNILGLVIVEIFWKFFYGRHKQIQLLNQ